MNNLLNIKNIVLDVDLTTKDDCLHLISEMAVKNLIASDSDMVFRDLQEREQACTTGLLDGFAIPHCKSSAILDSRITIIKSNSSIEWETMDGKPVNFVICFLLSEEAYKENQLKLLSHISKKLMNEEIKKNLMNADSPEEIISTLVGGK